MARSTSNSTRQRAAAARATLPVRKWSLAPTPPPQRGSIPERSDRSGQLRNLLEVVVLLLLCRRRHSQQHPPDNIASSIKPQHHIRNETAFRIEEHHGLVLLLANCQKPVPVSELHQSPQHSGR